MVLETRLIQMRFIAAIIFISSGCAANDSEVTDQAKAGGYELTLKMSQNSCILDSKTLDISTSKALDIKPPCYFLRQNSKSIQSFSYEDVGVLSTIIVVGSMISKEKREKWKIEEDAICGESRQAVLLKNSGIVVTEKTVDGGVICKDKGADEKEFWYFAH